MKKYLAFVLIFIVCMTMLSSLAGTIVKPFALRCESKDWWRTKNGWESFQWVDHTSRTNTSYRLITNEVPVKVSASRYILAEIDKDLNIVTYTVKDASIRSKDGYKYNIENVAPATYNLSTGKFYTEMTEDEKRGLWIAYTNKVIEADKASEARWTAPAKFDISKTPKEYLAELLKDRKWSGLILEEQDELKAELETYSDEWLRINDPKTYFGLEWHMRYEWFRDDSTEQQKKARSDRSMSRRNRAFSTENSFSVTASSDKKVEEMRAAELKSQQERSAWCKEQMVDWNKLN